MKVLWLGSGTVRLVLVLVDLNLDAWLDSWVRRIWFIGKCAQIDVATGGFSMTLQIDGVGFDGIWTSLDLRCLYRHLPHESVIACLQLS